jgi:hypothetical protein
VSEEEETIRPVTEEELLAQLEELGEDVHDLHEEVKQIPAPLVELPLLNANIEVATFPAGEDGAPTKAILITYPPGANGAIIGGVGVQLPFALRFVIPLTADAASELSTALSKAGIVIASKLDLPK